MNKKSGNVFFTLVATLAIFMTVAWFANIGKLFFCDWDASKSWKGEVAAVIGVVIPPAAAITVFINDN